MPKTIADFPENSGRCTETATCATPLVIINIGFYHEEVKKIG